jgi:hypothetical protein
MKRNCNCNVNIKSGVKITQTYLTEIGAITTKSLYCYLILILNKINISIATFVRLPHRIDTKEGSLQGL